MESYDPAWPVIPGIRTELPRPGVAMLVLDRPGRLNAIDLRMMHGLPGLLTALAEDDAVRAVVLRGAGDAFCAGADLTDVGSTTGMSREDSERDLAKRFTSTTLLTTMPKPTIAAVTGPAAGGGLAIALACDIRIAAPHATFVSPFIKMGLVPDYGASHLLARQVGADVALEMALTGRKVGAEEALRLGLVTRIADDPVAAALDLAATIAELPAEGVRGTTDLIRHAQDRDLTTTLAEEARLQSEILAHPDFIARRAHWRHKITGR